MTGAAASADPAAAAGSVTAANPTPSPASSGRPIATLLGPPRPLAAPLLFYALLGVFALLPFRAPNIVHSPAQDLYAHLSGIVEAANAMREGQFPVRVAPNQAGGRRLAFFQFYGNAPYTAGALLTFIPRVHPYTAWKIVTALTLALGGWYTYRCGLTLTRQVWPSLVAGVVFVTAPYLGTDVRSRFAFAESVAFCLLPAVVYYSLRAYISPRRAIGAVLAGGVFWSLLALSHNIAFLYASALIGLFFVTCASFSVKGLKRLVRVGCCYGLGGVLSLWYLAPQLHAIKYLAITGNPQPPLAFLWLAPLRVLLSPVMTIAPGVDTPNFGLQIGWPILAAVLLGAAWLLAGVVSSTLRPGGRAGRGYRRHGLLARVLLGWAVAVLLVWSPVTAMWHAVPSVFYAVQFTYRLLMFVVLWGGLAVAMALALCFRRRPMGRAAGYAALLLAGVAAMPHIVWRHRPHDLHWRDELLVRPDIGSQSVHAYQTNPAAAAAARDRLTVPPGAKLIPAAEAARSTEYGKSTRYGAPPGDGTLVVQLPVFHYPGLTEVRVNRERVAHGHIDGLVAVALEPGERRVAVRFVGFRWANAISAMAWTAVVVALAMFGARAAARRRAVARSPSIVARGRRAFPWHASLAGFVVVAVPMLLAAAGPAVSAKLRRYTLGRVTASSENGPSLRVANAFDGDPGTAWAAAGASPATLTIERPRASRVSRIELEARETALLEAWHEVRVVLYAKGLAVSGQTFSLPDAGRVGLQELKLATPVEADKIELQFSRPVTWRRDTGEDVDPGRLSPGYREIRIR